jgi:hypothetical protein
MPKARLQPVMIAQAMATFLTISPVFVATDKWLPALRS